MCVILFNYCTGMGEAEVHLAARGRVRLSETRGTWLGLKRFGRMTRPMTYLAEIKVHLAETLEGLVETTETTGIWPMADPCHDESAWPSPLGRDQGDLAGT